MTVVVGRDEKRIMRDGETRQGAFQNAREDAPSVSREDRLAEIMALPEDERVGALLDAGFNTEAASEQESDTVASEQESDTVASDEGKDSSGDIVTETQEASAVHGSSRKAGRPRKSKR